MIGSIDVHRFSFERKNHPGYWSLHIVNVTTSNGTQSFGVTKIGAPLQFSYHCDQEVVFVNGSDTFNITGGFQVLYFILQFIGRVRAS